jgi:hypothetical protein
MAEPVQLHSFKEMVDVLAAQRRGVEYDETEQAATIATGEPDLYDGKIVVQWDAQEPFVHIIQPMLLDVPAEHADAVGRAVCRANVTTKVGALGYNEDMRLVYHKVSLVRMKDGVRSDYVVNISRALTQSAKELLPAMRAAVAGSPSGQTAPVQTFEAMATLIASKWSGVRVDEKTQELWVPTGDGELPQKLLVRWEAEDKSLQMILPMISDVPSASAGTITRAICRINDQQRLAGLGYSESSRMIYYRVSLVRMKQGISSEYLVAMTSAIMAVAKNLVPAMRLVASGGSVDEAAKLAGA